MFVVNRFLDTVTENNLGAEGREFIEDLLETLASSERNTKKRFRKTNKWNWKSVMSAALSMGLPDEYVIQLESPSPP